MVRVFWVWRVILILFFVFSSSLEAEVFKWVDDSGKTHYTDEPLKGKDYEWVDDDEGSYIAYQPSNKLQNKNSPISTSRTVSPKTSPQQEKARGAYGKTKVETPARQNSIRGGISLRQNTTSRSSGRGNSVGGNLVRQNATRGSSARGGSAGGTSLRQNATERSSGRGSSVGGNAVRQNATRRSSGRGSSKGSY